MKIVVHTAIYGGYDVLKKQPKQTLDVDFVCHTDGEVKIEEGAKREVIKQGMNHGHPRLNAKRFRTHPSEVFPNYDIHIWMDGSGRLLSEKSVEHFIDCLGSGDIALFRNPERDTIEEEAVFCLNQKKYISMAGEALTKQTKFYERMGFDTRKTELTATWLLVSKNNGKMERFFDDWRKENIYWSRQDQVSFGFVERNNPDVSRVFIPWNLWENERVDFRNPHQRTW